MNNSTHLTRRSFLKTAAAAAAASAFAGQGRAAQPKPKWLVGCRDVHLKAVDKTDGWAALEQLDADCFEAEVNDDFALSSFSAPGKKYTVATPEGIAALKADLKAHRRRISAFCLHNKFDQRLEKEIEMCVALAQASGQLGVPVIRIDVVPRALKLEEFAPFAVKACKQLCAATKGLKIRFGIENHGRVTNDPDFVERLLAGAGSDRLGITLDTANLYWWGHPLDELYRIYERFAPHTVHTHCKSIRYPEDKRNVKREMGWEYGKYCCPVYEGDLDFHRITTILRQAGYRGDLCVEDESLSRFPEADRPENLKKQIAFLRKLV
jgi:sugar phosphate isomerase/epimerase